MNRPSLQLFVLSFAALFLELMLIRWVPSVFRLVAYYANLMLISSFLGLGLGALLHGHRIRLAQHFPWLLSAYVAFLLMFRELMPPGQGLELRFFAVPAQLVNYLVLVGIFVVNTTLFVPLGQAIGERFHALPALQAYRWDLSGSLCGTVAFGLFSFFYFSPIVGLALTMLLFLGAAEPGWRVRAAALFAPALVLMVAGREPAATWSPYHHITLIEDPFGDPHLAGPPPADLASRRDPPFYAIQVNQDFYQYFGALDPARYSTPPAEISGFLDQYGLPYALRPRPAAVLVVGAGSGMDVQAALLAGAGRVDAVEIDPVIVELSQRYNASRVLDDPRVRVRVDDARALLEQTHERYDAVIFGFLDSQALFSSMSNVRLDGFVYTVESLRSAWERVNEGGLLALSFFVAEHEWLARKLIGMLRAATGGDVVVYAAPMGQMVFAVARGAAAPPPASIGAFSRVELPAVKRGLATDDWPYLYLAERTIPRDYAVVMLALLALSAAFVLGATRRLMAREQWHFFFLGFGFLLLQTRSIVDCSLYFGATWFVTTVLVAGLLLMALAANAVAARMRQFSLWLYVPLLASLAVLYAVPQDWILQWSFAGRILWTLLAVPGPVFFAGLIFSGLLRQARDPAAAFGANLVGATLGGFAEYLGMVVGHQSLSLLLISAYLASLLFIRTPKTSS